MANPTTSLTDTRGDGQSNGVDPERLRAQIAETRNEMSGTLEELHGRLNPVVFKEQVVEQFREAAETIKADLKSYFQDAKETVQTELVEAKSALKSEVLDEVQAAKSRFNEEMVHAKAAVREATIGKVENMIQQTQKRVRVASRSAMDTIKDNPIPAALAGAGLAWLFLSSRRKRNRPELDVEVRDQPRAIARTVEHEEPESTDAGSTGEQIRDFAQHTGKKVADATHDAASAVSHFAQSAKDSASDVAHRAQGTAIELSRDARKQVRRVRRRSSELYRSNPIAVGTAMLALGTAIGLGIPSTKTEDDLVGGARDDVLKKGRQLAHQAFEKAGDAVAHVGAADAEPAQSQRPEERSTASGRTPAGSA